MISPNTSSMVGDEAADSDALLAEVAAFQASIAAPTPFTAVSDLIADGGDNAALYDRAGRQPLTFAQLRRFSSGFSLRRFGISRDSVVCTAIPNGAEAAVCFWAISRECVFAPLNPGLTVPEVEFELTDLPCHTMILMDGDRSANTAAIVAACDRHGVNVLRLVPNETTVGLFELEGTTSEAPSSEVQRSDLALVLHTSGTTKKPKIVPLTHDNLGQGIQFVASTLRRQQTDLCLNVMPLFHIHGLIANLGVSAYARAPVVCSAFMGGDDFLEQLRRPSLRPTWYSAVPTMHEAILLAAEKRGKALDHSLRLMRNCSAALLPPLSKRILKAFGEELGQPFTVVPTYAMTESFPICSNPPHLQIKLSTVGPSMGPTIKILAGHPSPLELPRGVEGEVCVSGPCVTAGYLMRDHMSQNPNIEAFTPADSPVGRMLRTGDKGYLDADGYLQLVGRFKEIINVGGEKVSPLDMEDQLLRVTGVETCVCFASPAEMLGEVVGVACVPKAGLPWPTLQELSEGMPHTAARFKPRVLVIMDAIPKGPTGKPKRIGLAKMLGIPAVSPAEESTYRVEGEGAAIGEPTRVSESGARLPVWQFPLTISLEVSPDLGDEHRLLHELRIEDSLCMEFALTVSAFICGSAVPIDMKIEPDEVKEALECVRRTTEERGMQWKAKCGEHGRCEDWCGEVTVSDGGKTLSHYWESGCSDTPPGRLMRLLRVLECGFGTETGAPDDPNGPWLAKAAELGLVLDDSTATDVRTSLTPTGAV